MLLVLPCLLWLEKCFSSTGNTNNGECCWCSLALYGWKNALIRRETLITFASDLFARLAPLRRVLATCPPQQSEGGGTKQCVKKISNKNRIKPKCCWCSLAFYGWKNALIRRETPTTASQIITFPVNISQRDTHNNWKRPLCALCFFAVRPCDLSAATK